jgi:hypothetical protein
MSNPTGSYGSRDPYETAPQYGSSGGVNQPQAGYNPLMAGFGGVKKV